jgi:hypothetical protein
MWLDAPVVDSLHRNALERAFDDAVLYDDAVRVAARARARVTRRGTVARPVHHQRRRPLRTRPAAS